MSHSARFGSHMRATTLHPQTMTPCPHLKHPLRSKQGTRYVRGPPLVLKFRGPMIVTGASRCHGQNLQASRGPGPWGISWGQSC